MRKQKMYIYCFSPPVMLATFLFEIAAALYILFRYNRTTTASLIIAVLVCLATFQGAEYLLCGGFGIPGGVWSRVGYSAISLLPPLGLHLVYSIAGKQNRPLTIAAYATGALFISYYSFYSPAVTGHTCYANYVAFQGDGIPFASEAYALYYYGWLLSAVYVAFRLSKRATGRIKNALIALMVGYASFIVPTTTANLIDPSTIAGIPSIMCGFAVLLAAVLVARVAPDTLQEKSALAASSRTRRS